MTTTLRGRASTLATLARIEWPNSLFVKPPKAPCWNEGKSHTTFCLEISGIHLEYREISKCSNVASFQYFCTFRGLLCRRVQKSMFVTSLHPSIHPCLHTYGVTKSADGGYRDRIFEHFATNAELWGSQNRYIFTRRKDRHDLAWFQLSCFLRGSITSG